MAFLILMNPAVLLAAAQTVPQHILESIVDDEPSPLSRARGSYRLPQLPPLELLQPRTMPMRVPSEYERSSGVLMRWGSFNRVLTQIAVGITTGDPEAVVHILVRGSSQEQRALATLDRAGADVSRIVFIRYLTDSAWMRDYGPRLLESPGRAGGIPLLLDPTYNRARPRDDAFPGYLSRIWELETLDVALVHSGGNFHVFSDGDAFVSDLILQENSDLELWELQAYFLTLARLQLTVLPSLPHSYDGTGHIDMWLLPVRNREVIVGRYPTRDKGPHQIPETTVSELVARGYRVYRTPGWRSRGSHHTYTNSLIFNDLVFVPKYQSYDRRNAEALATFREAFPEKEIIPVESSRIIAFEGALHCAVLQIPQAER